VGGAEKQSLFTDYLRIGKGVPKSSIGINPFGNAFDSDRLIVIWPMQHIFGLI